MMPFSGEPSSVGHGLVDSATDQLPVLFRDEHLFVVNKPSGLLVHNGWGRERVTALSLARDLVGRHVYPIHRLDRATSGVLVFALSPEVARAAQVSLAAEATVKRYMALVRGITPESGVINHPLNKEGSEEKRPALTEYRRLGTFERYSLVSLTLLTGRQHQARRHFKHISHPLIGDVKYGKGEHNRLMRERFGLSRLALHAFELSWVHPLSGEQLRHRAPLPADLAQPLLAMGLSWPAIAADAQISERDSGAVLPAPSGIGPANAKSPALVSLSRGAKAL